MAVDRLPPIVDLRLLGQCDLACPYCFGPRHELKAMPTRDALRVLTFLAERGVESVVFTGGEPCLVPDLPVLLRHARALGLGTVLSTNGITFLKRIGEVAPELDWVGLPLDAASAETNRIMRPGRADQHECLPLVVRELRRTFPDVRIKLGTVACALNKHDIAGIPEHLGPAKPDVWKIYQVVYSSYGADNKDVLTLTDEDFEAVLDAVAPVAADWGVPVVAYRRSERPGRYLFIEPTGQALTTRVDDEVLIGNILHDPNAVARAWRSVIDEDSMMTNFRQTYPA